MALVHTAPIFRLMQQADQVGDHHHKDVLQLLVLRIQAQNEFQYDATVRLDQPKQVAVGEGTGHDNEAPYPTGQADSDGVCSCSTCERALVDRAGSPHDQIDSSRPPIEEDSGTGIPKSLLHAFDSIKQSVPSDHTFERTKLAFAAVPCFANSAASTNQSHSILSPVAVAPSNHDRRMDPPSESLSLHTGFIPSETDVICGKGKKVHRHPGNVRYRALVTMYVEQYAQAMTKTYKSVIVCKIINLINESASIPGAGFVRFDPLTGRWEAISEDAAREKVGQALRAALIDLNPGKKAAKNQRRAELKRIRNANVRRQQQETTLHLKHLVDNKEVHYTGYFSE